MAFSDWDQTIGGGSSSTPIQNSTVTPNILTIGGTYCRQLISSGYFTGCSYLAKSTYGGGAFYNTPNTSAIRLQGYFRLVSAGGFSSPYNTPSIFGLGAKVGTDFMSGYRLGFGIGGALLLSFKAESYAYRTHLTLTTLSLNTWYGLRLEVFPLGTSGDQIKCYTENTPGSGTWTKHYDQFIASTSGDYVAWGGNNRNGFALRVEGDLGGGVGNMNGYVDKVTLTTAVAPTPIP